MLRKSFLVFIIVLSLKTAIYAYRPFNTEDAGIAPMGENKLEFGFEGWGITKNSVRNTNITFLVGIGLGKAEILFESPYCTKSNIVQEEGLQDMVMAAKIRVAGRDDAGVSLKTEYAFKSSIYCLSGVASYSFEWMIVHAQSGWMNNFERNGFFGGVGLDFPVLDSLSIILDSFIEHIDRETSYAVLVGGICEIGKGFLFDAAIGNFWINEVSNQRDFIATMGCSIIL